MTTSIQRTLQYVADEANANAFRSLLRRMRLGTMLAPLKRAFTGLTGAASFDLTAIDGTGETAGVANPNRLAALKIVSLRVTAAGTANSQGSYAVADAGAAVLSPTNTTKTGLALISDDGKTVTFPTADVTAFVIEYIPTFLSLAQWQEPYPTTGEDNHLLRLDVTAPRYTGSDPDTGFL